MTDTDRTLLERAATPFGEWLAEAERLAEQMADAACAVYWEEDQGRSRDVPPLQAKLDAARAALSAHLRRVPMGRPVWVHRGVYEMVALDGFEGGAQLSPTQTDPEDIPLYTKPEGME